jgi:RNA polymerase sigma-70 factor (ECF subfamily)
MKTMDALTTRTTEKHTPSTILRRIAERDQNAVKDCFDTYGNFIWALASKFTNTTEEADAAVQEIFLDIWRYAEREKETELTEKLLIGLIARKRLIKHLQ